MSFYGNTSVVIKERRRYIRFLPKDNAFAALGEGFSKIGKIIDISAGGLSFGYMSQLENNNNEHSILAIFMADNAFHVRNLPCKVVSDIPVNIYEGSIDSSISVISRRCGIKFTDFSASQNENLENFLTFHTIGLAPISKDFSGTWEP